MKRTGERIRDYKKEYDMRKERIRRIHADLERGKIDRFKKHLQANNTTFAKWLDRQIDNELEKG